jgi:hypothetical protein
MARRLPAVPLRYKMCLLIVEDQIDAAKRNISPSVSIDFDRYAEAVDFCNRFAEGGWWQIYDRHVDKVIATHKSHGPRKQ